jgi:Zn-dependent protease with chaperone function
VNVLPMQTLLQTISRTSVEQIFNALPAGFIIALFAWFVLRSLKRQNAGTRFAVWFFALIAIASLPLLTQFGQGRARVLPSNLAAISIPENWALFIFLAWAVGASVAMLRLAVGVWRLRKLRSSCKAIDQTSLDPRVQKALDSIQTPLSKTWLSTAQLSTAQLSTAQLSTARAAAKVFVPKPISIAVSEEIRVPAAIGFWKRTIVLPAWTLRELSPEDLNAILLHEFAHLRRGDDWTNLIQKIVRALFFFHPAVWWIDQRLSMEREMACDDAVLAETGNPHGYATCLVSLLEKSMSRRGWTMAQAAVHRAREASLRLTEILNKNRPAATRVWTPAVGMVGIFSLLCLAAMPHVPKLIAVDAGTTASHAPVLSATLSQPAFTNGASPNEATVVPARLVRTRMDTSAKLTPVKQTAFRSARPEHHLAPTPVAARLNTPTRTPRERVVEASATSQPETMPQFQTLVFVQTVQYGDSNSPIFVQVWQLTWINRTPAIAAKLPVANSI